VSFLKNFKRGYTDADIASARHKVDGLPVRLGNPDHVTLRLTRREWRAFFGEGMNVDDGMKDAAAEGCHLPPVKLRLVR
jgi:hypothetical protein